MQIPIKLFNTLTGHKEEFKPIKSGEVSMYNCGPTVYNYAHIGNLRAYVFVDVLRRTLEYNGYKVRQVMNITDVGHNVEDEDLGEDKMEKGAKREGLSVWEIADKYIEQFKDKTLIIIMDYFNDGFLTISARDQRKKIKLNELLNEAVADLPESSFLFFIFINYSIIF